MSEDIYANVETTEDSEADLGDHDSSYEEVHENQDNLQTQDQRSRKFQQSESSGVNNAGSKYYRVTTVCVVLLCVLLLSAITVMGIKFSNLSTENNQLQGRYYNLTSERDQLLTNYSTLTSERDQLLTNYSTLTSERDQLQTNYNTLTGKRDDLESSYISIIKERDQFQKQKDELQNKGWIFFSYKFYYISTKKKTWTESRQDCIEKGLDLVIINSKEEQDFVIDLSKSKNPGVYIGLTDHDTEGVWKWVDGTSMTTAYWSSGNKFSDNEDCVVIRYDGNMNGWYDIPCTEMYYWICE